MKSSILVTIIVILLLLTSCRHNSRHVNINNIDLEISITRLEKALFEGDPAFLPERLKIIKRDHYDFLRIFGYVINIGDIDSEEWDNSIIEFATDRQNVEVYGYVNDIYPDLTELEKAQTRAWKHYRYYFPDLSVPQIYTCMSGFNNSIIVGDSLLGIGLDRYLGANNPFYPMLGIYGYLSRNMVPEKIVSDCMYGWAATTWELDKTGEQEINLLETVLHEGRLLFFTQSMIPDESDTLIFGFNSMQLKFCLNNESQIWEYLVEHDLLFSTDPMVINKLTEEAPFTGYFTSESPGKAANWIGFRIVESYMLKNPDISLEELMRTGDLRQILEMSKYSPG